VFAVAGIARPERFFTSLTDAGYDVAGTMAFNDHHRFTAADVERMSAEAARAGATVIVTTSKDAIRLEGFGPWTLPLVEVPLEVSVDPDEAFRMWLLRSLRDHQQSIR
jgi:tetraacyldisaccharide 4'-kinase